MNTAYALVLDLLTFVGTQTIGPVVNRSAGLIGAHRLRVLAISILPWLKVASRQTSIFINTKYVWHNDLVRLVEECEEFRALFLYDGSSIILSPLLSEQTLLEIKTVCKERYNPPLISKG